MNGKAPEVFLKAAGPHGHGASVRWLFAISLGIGGKAFAERKIMNLQAKASPKGVRWSLHDEIRRRLRTGKQKLASRI